MEDALDVASGGRKRVRDRRILGFDLVARVLSFISSRGIEFLGDNINHDPGRKLAHAFNFPSLLRPGARGV